MEVARNSIRYVNMVVQRTGYIIGVGTCVQYFNANNIHITQLQILFLEES